MVAVGTPCALTKGEDFDAFWRLFSITPRRPPCADNHHYYSQSTELSMTQVRDVAKSVGIYNRPHLLQRPQALQSSALSQWLQPLRSAKKLLII
jgi:hypothetical protein